jgi:nicotinamide riboside kinase
MEAFARTGVARVVLTGSESTGKTTLLAVMGHVAWKKSLGRAAVAIA